MSNVYSFAEAKAKRNNASSPVSVQDGDSHNHNDQLEKFELMLEEKNIIELQLFMDQWLKEARADGLYENERTKGEGKLLFTIIYKKAESYELKNACVRLVKMFS